MKKQAKRDGSTSMLSNQDLVHLQSPLSSEKAQQELFAIDDNKDLVTNPGSYQDVPSVLGFGASREPDPNLMIRAIGNVSTKKKKPIK